MTRSYSKRTDPRIPPEVRGLQLNTCRNPLCSNFGVPPKDHIPKGRLPVELRDTYALKSTKDREKVRDAHAMMCLVCNGQFRLVSNQGVLEELDRFLQPLLPSVLPGCPNTACVNHAHSVAGSHGRYIQYGQTPRGSQRYRCLCCKKTFTASIQIGRRLRQPEKTELIFSLLVNKSPMRRICEVAGVNAVTLYQRIDLIYKKCMRVAQRYEHALMEGDRVARMHVAVDRQDHTFNWGSQFDRRVVILRAIASADAKSGYILAQHLNFEPNVDPQEIELAARECGDDLRSAPFRRMPRFWLRADYKSSGQILEESGEVPDEEVKLPSRGIQIFENYTLFGHFLFLSKLLKGVQKIRFSLDREPNIQAACLLAFREWLVTDKLSIFLVRINKEMTNDRKGIALATAERLIARHREAHPELSEIEIALELIKQRHRQVQEEVLNPSGRWIDHPLPNMNEPSKSLLCVTAKSDSDVTDLAWGYLRSSLNAIDRYFMQVRRRISVLERPISTASNASRRWHGYQAYNPEVGMKLLEIFRVVYNHHLIGKGNETPAQRLGLSPVPLTLKDILDA